MADSTRAGGSFSRWSSRSTLGLTDISTLPASGGALPARRKTWSRSSVSSRSALVSAVSTWADGLGPRPCSRRTT
uniref:Uncharacterized protein n=1 Tax=Streptomyces sp. NBC_01401 TaxID=2903854 RepID=A0AAU3GRK7_9ACTN